MDVGQIDEKTMKEECENIAAVGSQHQEETHSHHQRCRPLSMQELDKFEIKRIGEWKYVLVSNAER